MLSGKKIIVGITGSIAAYKAAILVRMLVREGAEVRVLMTPLAKQFITPLTMATLSKHPILVDFFNPENGEWNSHVSLGEWADAYLIAPASANTLGKMAHGIADNLLLTTFLSAKCPVLAAPAMDLDMFVHPATRENLDILIKRGTTVIEPESGELASGLSGKGRMAEPENIVEYLRRFFGKEQTWKDRKILVTAGGTIEPIDPVRYVSNHSTGKMGYAIADTLACRGAKIFLVHGNVSVRAEHPNITEIYAPSAKEMLDASLRIFPECDAAVMSAAVADYTPVAQAKTKIKKRGEEWSLDMCRTEDIAARLGASKGNRLLVGFALETDHAEQNARRKLERKNLDLIVLNTMEDAGAGFGYDTNKITLIDRQGGLISFPLKSKKEAAADIADKMEELFFPK